MDALRRGGGAIGPPHRPVPHPSHNLIVRWVGNPRTKPASTQRKPLTQINAPYLNIIPQLMRRASTEDAALGDDVSAVSHAQRFAHIVIGNQYPDAARFEIEDDLLQLQHRNRIDAAERLVKQNEVRLNAESPRNLNAPPL